MLTCFAPAVQSSPLGKLTRMRASGPVYGGKKIDEIETWCSCLLLTCISYNQDVSVESQVQERLGRGWTGSGG